MPIGRRGSYVGYLEPWANVSNTPFRGYKTATYEGGGRSPFIAHAQRVQVVGHVLHVR